MAKTTDEKKKRDTRRRGRGEGGVYRRDSDGLWCGTITVGFDANGKRKRRTVYGKTKRECLGKLDELKNQKRTGTLTTTDTITVSQFFLSWVETAYDGQTLPVYRSTIKKHINPWLGGVRLSKLDSAKIQLAVSSMIDAGTSPTMVREMVKVLRRGLNQAVKQELLPFNPAAAGRVTTPPVPQTEMKVLTAEQARAFLAHVESSRNYGLFLLAISIGLRQGELIGLKWDDIDLKTGTLSVR